MTSPSTISSAHLVRYSWARWIGLRVWNATTVFQPRSRDLLAQLQRSQRYSRELVGEHVLEHGDFATDVDRGLRVEVRDARMLRRRSSCK